MNPKQFRAWLEARGMHALRVYRMPSTGRLRASLAGQRKPEHGGGNFAELHAERGTGYVYIRDGNVKGEPITYTYGLC